MHILNWSILMWFSFFFLTQLSITTTITSPCIPSQFKPEHPDIWQMNEICLTVEVKHTWFLVSWSSSTHMSSGTPCTSSMASTLWPDSSSITSGTWKNSSPSSSDLKAEVQVRESKKKKKKNLMIYDMMIYDLGYLQNWKHAKPRANHTERQLTLTIPLLPAL